MKQKTLYFALQFFLLFSISLVSVEKKFVLEDAPLTDPTDYFRSKQSGEWTDLSVWESSVDGLNWNDATVYPNELATQVIIQSNDTVLLNSSGIKLRNTEIYGALEIRDFNFEVHGSIIGLYVKDGGEFIVNGIGHAQVGSAFALIETGGKLTVQSAQNDFVKYYLDADEGLFTFENDAVCDWKADVAPSFTGYEFLMRTMNENDVPIFRISTDIDDFGSTTNNAHFNSILEIDGDFNLELKGTKDITFASGIQGNGTLKITHSSSGKFFLGDSIRTATLGNFGNLTLNIAHNLLRVQNIEVPPTAHVTIQSHSDANPNTFTRFSNNLDIYGVLDITDMRIVNTADGMIVVKDGGTLRTSFTNGLFGGGSAIVNSDKFQIDEGSTIEYYAVENQRISSGKRYYHLILSGEGIKTPQSAINFYEIDSIAQGSVTIKGNPIVDFSGNNLAPTALNDVNFNMDGGKLIIGTGGTQPRMGGSYNITAGTIEFTGDSNTSIRVLPIYQNIIISGRKKTTGGMNFRVENILNITSTGTLRIPSSNDLSNSYYVAARKGIQIEENGELILGHNANLIQDEDAVNFGKIKVEKNFTFSAERNQYNFVISPVKDQNIKELFETNDYLAQKYNEETNYFDFFEGEYLGAGIGQAIEENQNGDAAQTATYYGEPHNGTINVSGLTNGNTRFQLAGNPYPSQLDLVQFYTDNEYNIESTFLFWDNRGNTEITQQGDDYSGDNYAKFNASSGTGTAAIAYENSDEYEGKVPTKNLAVGNAFMLRLNSGASSYTFNNAQRNTLGAVNFLGRTNDANPLENSISLDRYWLTLNTPNGATVMNAVVYFDGGNDGFAKDDSKITGGSDDIYTLVDEHQLKIQGKSSFDVNDKIKLGYKAFAPGIHTISIYDKEGVFADGQKIFIRDLKNDIVHELTASDFTFKTFAGEFNDRFEIFYKRSIKASENKATLSNVIIYQNENHIQIAVENQLLSDVEIYDLNGISVYQATDINLENWQVPNHLFGKGILVVVVKTADGEVVNKKLVNK